MEIVVGPIISNDRASINLRRLRLLRHQTGQKFTMISEADPLSTCPLAYIIHSYLSTPDLAHAKSKGLEIPVYISHLTTGRTRTPLTKHIIQEPI